VADIWTDGQTHDDSMYCASIASRGKKCRISVDVLSDVLSERIRDDQKRRYFVVGPPTLASQSKNTLPFIGTVVT